MFTKLHDDVRIPEILGLSQNNDTPEHLVYKIKLWSLQGSFCTKSVNDIILRTHL